MSEVVQKEFVYQPTDDHGREWGLPISIKYTTDDELREALEQANADVVGKVARQKLKTRIDVYPDAEKYVEGLWNQERIEQEALVFAQSTPEYHGTPASFQALVAFMEKHQLSPTAKNWRLAFDALTEIGMLAPGKGIAPAQKSARLLTRDEVEVMPSEVYRKRLLSDPEFVEHVEKLYR
jgi:hypothetical protein